MVKREVRAAFCAIAVCALFATSARAQAASSSAPQDAASQPARAVAPSGPRNVGEIAVMYSFTEVRVHGLTTTFDKGWNVKAAKRIQDSAVSLVATFTGIYADSTDFGTLNPAGRVLAILGGARFSSRRVAAPVNPFGEIAFGSAHDNGNFLFGPCVDTDLACRAGSAHNHFSMFQFSGGVDLRAGRRAAVRAQVDVPVFLSFNTARKGFGGSVGLVIPFTR
jgi:hypothetical protein